MPAEPGPCDASSAQEAADYFPHRRRLAIPSWLVSAVVHAVGMLVLAFVTLGTPQQIREMIQISSVEADEMAEIELAEASVDIDPAELAAVESLAVTVPDLGGLQFVDATSSADLTSSDLGNLGTPDTAIGDIRGLFDANGMGMNEIGMGKGMASFFGVKTRGRRIVYVVDNSNSMSGGKFETACAELMRSVGQLEKRQQFYVIFFSDTAYPLFYPHTSKQMMPATEENKRRLGYWLDSVQRCLRTKGEDAMRLAFALNSDAIYILGDGAFTDRTVEKMLAQPPMRQTVHTLGFRMKPEAEKDLRAIARRFNGSFKEVSVSSEMAQLSKQVDRPRNTMPNGAWGIMLGTTPKNPGLKPKRKKRRKT